MVDLRNEARQLIKEGVYDPDTLFRILYQKHNVHYSRVREAVHAAKNA